MTDLRCSATIATLPSGIVTCHRDGRDHKGDHYYDEIEERRVVRRIVWSDWESGYSSIPARRLR